MFYIKPPVGKLFLHVIENCIATRLKYLDHLYNDTLDEFNGNFEYLLEGTIYDKIGHFTSRLLASTSSDSWEYWFVRETLLLKHRLNNVTTSQINRFFRSIIRQLREFEDKEDLITVTLRQTCVFFLQSFVFSHIVSKCRANDCKSFHCKVRFELLPELVKTRKVDLIEGYAIVYCSQWKLLFQSLFNAYITEDIKRTKLHALRIIQNDTRLDYLSQIITFPAQRIQCEYGKLSTENIDVEVNKFPLCMQHLHAVLRNRHRLSHYARLYYSLFLKDSGMNLQNAIKYWKNEYSKPHACTSTCSHTWQKNEKKFIYSIRHLYGLEGSRRNYESPNCRHMRTHIPGAKYEGGCPFINFDVSTLKSLLNTSWTEEDTDKFLEITSPQRPETICTSYFRLIHKINDDNIMISSPKQYYLMACDVSSKL